MTRPWHPTREHIVRWLKPSAESFAAAAAVYSPEVMLQLEATKGKLHKRLHTHRMFDEEQVGLNEKAPTCGAFAEPSDGLEPSTPSLPFRCARNYLQSRARDSA